MKRFAPKFEDHKIPEWYDRYFRYGEIKKVVHEFKDDPDCYKLEGFFNVKSNTHKVVNIELDKHDLRKI